jgi:hypothetical protein
VFFGNFWAYVGQPHGHIGWAISMSFASCNPTNPRPNPWNFHKKILRIGGFEKWPFFESAILIFFALSLWKLVTHYVLEWMGLKFYDNDGLQPKISPPKHFSRQCIYLYKFTLKISWNYGVRNREGASEKTVSTS